MSRSCIRPSACQSSTHVFRHALLTSPNAARSITGPSLLGSTPTRSRSISPIRRSSRSGLSSSAVMARPPPPDSFPLLPAPPPPPPFDLFPSWGKSHRQPLSRGGFAADSRAEGRAIRAGHPGVESLEFRQHRVAWRASRRRVGLDRVQALQRSSEAVAPAPQQRQFKICLLAEVKGELAATFPRGE